MPAAHAIKSCYEQPPFATSGEPRHADYAWPYGVCRQVMMEFCNPEEFIVIVAKSENDYKV